MKAVMFMLACTIVVAAAVAQKRTTISAGTGNPEHGRYLVENVAMCIQCHTPRTENGDLLLSRMLLGAPVPVAKPYAFQQWAEYAPRIAGLPQYTDQQILALLTTGVGRDGMPLRAPMPTFRMSLQDAQDVVTYLKSLP